MKLLQCDGGLELIVLDATFIERRINSHFSLSDSLELLRRLKPRRALLTGMTHDFDYHFWLLTFQVSYFPSISVTC